MSIFLQFSEIVQEGFGMWKLTSKSRSKMKRHEEIEPFFMYMLNFVLVLNTDVVP